jgi:hypothetical protein
MPEMRLRLVPDAPKVAGELRQPGMSEPVLEHSETEEWRVVASSPSYEVSSLGRVRRTTYLAIYRDSNGYAAVSLYENNRKKAKRVHILVGEAGFLGPKPSPKHQINHDNMDTMDARAKNLKYETGLENMRHSFRNGNRLLTTPRGENHRLSKLQPCQIHCIRTFAAATRWRQRRIGEHFGITQHATWCII